MEALVLEHGKRLVPFIKLGLGSKSQIESKTSELDSLISVRCVDLDLDLDSYDKEVEILSSIFRPIEDHDLSLAKFHHQLFTFIKVGKGVLLFL